MWSLSRTLATGSVQGPPNWLYITKCNGVCLMKEQKLDQDAVWTCCMRLVDLEQAKEMHIGTQITLQTSMNLG